MTSRDFCYWLQGFFELANPPGALNATQVVLVQNHLALVFKHEIDPSAGGPEHQAHLSAIHAEQGAVPPVAPESAWPAGTGPMKLGPPPWERPPVYRC